MPVASPSCDNQTRPQIAKSPQTGAKPPQVESTSLEVEAGGLIGALCETAYDSFLKSFSSAIEEEKFKNVRNIPD